MPRSWQRSVWLHELSAAGGVASGTSCVLDFFETCHNMTEGKAFFYVYIYQKHRHPLISYTLHLDSCLHVWVDK